MGIASQQLMLSWVDVQGEEPVRLSSRGMHSPTLLCNTPLAHT